MCYEQSQWWYQTHTIAHSCPEIFHMIPCKKTTDPCCNVLPGIFLAHKPMDRTVVFRLHFDSRPLTEFCNQIIKSPKNAAFLLLPERLPLRTGLFD